MTSVRFLTIKTPLDSGDTNALDVIRISGTDSISEGFRFELDMFSENPDLVFSDIVGSRVTIAIGNVEPRYINGIVAAFEQGHRSGQTEQGLGHHTAYHATVVPWSWMLGKMTNNRIFQDKDVKEIIEQVFDERGDGQYEWVLEKTYPKRTYCVQYDETDLNFVSRLMEEEGIFYYFKHEDGQHTMMLTDSSSKLTPCPEQEKAEFKAKTSEIEEENFIFQLTCTRKIIPTQYTHSDYNFETPTTSLTRETPTVQQGQDTTSEREVYKYPGRYENTTDGERYGRLRMEAEEVDITTLNGESGCLGFTSGHHFTLENYGRNDLNGKKYLLLSVAHDASQGWERFGIPGVDHYANTFTCIPFETPFRPRRKSFRPRIYGVQTAKVVGPSGEEIWTDEHGRVKVQFHWDREHESDENSSCWIRVAQMLAGPGWGGMFIPRIDQEVIVEFLEGDPDRPIITGCVYHAHNTPPYPLPDEKTKSTFKSNSSPDGEGFNEIRIEDKTGEEQVFIRSQRNLDVRALNDSYETVGNERHATIEADRFMTIGGNDNLTVGGSDSISVGDKLSLKVGADMGQQIGGNLYQSVGGSFSVTAQNKCVLEANSNITLKVGGSYISIGQAGITIETSGTLELKGTMVDIKGNASVKIN